MVHQDLVNLEELLEVRQARRIRSQQIICLATPGGSGIRTLVCNITEPAGTTPNKAVGSAKTPSASPQAMRISIVTLGMDQ